MTPASRQALYAKARARDMGEVAYALKDALAVKEAREAFVLAYGGRSARLRRGLVRLLADDPDNLMAFFYGLISSDDGK